jgi:predicted glycosyltransferase
MKKVLVYSHDAYGLGNIRRMLEITSHLVNSDPDVSVLLISGSPMLHAFRIPPRVDYIKLPCVARSDKGESVVKSLGLSYENTIRLRANVIMMAALDFEPDLVLVDKKPFGIADELQPALSMLRKRGNPPKTVLLLRDILDEPRVTIRQWAEGGYHETIRAFYDQVLVVGESEIFDACEEYEFPAETRARVRHCGYIERPAPAKAPRQVRAEFGIGSEPMVLVTAGGGADGARLMSAYLEGLLDRPRRGFTTLMITGPEMSPAQRAELAQLAERAGEVVLREFTDDMMSCMNAADAVVSMGGYNTVCELLTLRKKTIVVPRVTPVREQWIRAHRMDRLGLLRALHPDTLTPRSLIDAVVEELARDDLQNPALSSFEMGGLPRISAALLGLLAAAAPAGASVVPISAARQKAGGAMPSRPRLAGAIEQAFGSAAQV